MSDFTLYIERDVNNFYRDPILYQEVGIKINKFSNEELLFFKYFHEKTNVFPKSILILNNFMFYFIDGKNYAEVNQHITSFRRNIKHKKILFIYVEDVLINLIHRFFPNIYIYDLFILEGKATPEVCITVLSYRERGIAIGRNGDYIKTVNKILEKFIDFKERNVTVSCVVHHEG